MSSWVEHVKQYRKQNPDLSYKDCLVKAKDSYSKQPPKPGSAASSSAALLPSINKDVEIEVKIETPPKELPPPKRTRKQALKPTPAKTKQMSAADKRKMEALLAKYK